MRKVYDRPSDKDANTWVYCDNCHERIGDSGRRHSHIPFRDKASQNFMKPVAHQGTTVGEVGGGDATGTQDEPEHEPQQGELPDDPVQMEVDAPQYPREDARREDAPREDEWIPEVP